MKNIHWGGIALLLLAYFIGAKYPGLAQRTGLV